ncbi:MAG: FkbM family methyltransferase [Clostridia bacterium]|nr:FkbM family methyltransferase [Clostridia bacterium]
MNNFKKHIFNTFSCDLWDYLKSSNKPILIYGMGNGADKIIRVLSDYGIEYNDFIILLSFGTHLEDVMNKIYELDENYELYSPDVPVCDGQIFNESFFDKHIIELQNARNLFCDDKSKEIFDDIIRFKLTGRLEFLRSTESNEESCDKLLALNSYNTYLDLGAYNGDTIRKFLNLCPNIKEIYAFEPDFRNFKKLLAYAQNEKRAKINAFNYASWNEDSILNFSASGNRNSSGAGTVSHQTKFIPVEAKRPDNIISRIDFIKYDVEGAEYNAILGSTGLITSCSPDLLISLYHKSEDLFELPLLINSISADYNLYLRRLPYIPAWDLNLYAIKKQAL